MIGLLRNVQGKRRSKQTYYDGQPEERKKKKTEQASQQSTNGPNRPVFSSPHLAHSSSPHANPKRSGRQSAGKTVTQDNGQARDRKGSTERRQRNWKTNNNYPHHGVQFQGRVDYPILVLRWQSQWCLVHVVRLAIVPNEKLGLLHAVRFTRDEHVLPSMRASDSQRAVLLWQQKMKLGPRNVVVPPGNSTMRPKNQTNVS